MEAVSDEAAFFMDKILFFRKVPVGGRGQCLPVTPEYV